MCIKEEDSPTLKIILMHRYKNSRNTLKKSKERLITATSNSKGNIRVNRNTRQENKMWRKVQVTKLARLQAMRPGYG